MAMKLRALLGLLQLPPARVRAGCTALAGAALMAYGTACVYVPAGEILGGLELALFGLLFVDVGRKP